jgi:5'-nucleotidase
VRSKHPLIIVTNDDGITSPGIKALIEVAKNHGDIVVIAPDKPQSGVGHAITISSTLRINKIKVFDDQEGYSCSGTPVDCIKLAVNEIMPRKPDLIVSGINHGSNCSINVIYSGTMSAAIEGLLEGIPSVGFSLLDYSIEADFTASKKVADKIIREVLKNKLPENVCLNVNIPKLSESEIMGIKICRQANANWIEKFDKRVDPSGREYYWLTGEFKNYDKGTDTDVWALANNYVSVVPTQVDLTAYQAIDALKKWKM